MCSSKVRMSRFTVDYEHSCELSGATEPAVAKDVHTNENRRRRLPITFHGIEIRQQGDVGIGAENLRCSLATSELHTRHHRHPPPVDRSLAPGSLCRNVGNPGANVLLQRVRHQRQDLLVLVEQEHDAKVAKPLVCEAVAGNKFEALDLAEVGRVAEHVNVQQLCDVRVAGLVILLLKGGADVGRLPLYQCPLVRGGLGRPQGLYEVFQPEEGLFFWRANGQNRTLVSYRMSAVDRTGHGQRKNKKRGGSLGMRVPGRQKAVSFRQARVPFVRGAALAAKWPMVCVCVSRAATERKSQLCGVRKDLSPSGQGSLHGAARRGG
ncbi:MAG: hypothetical protein BJ554DRAFT_3712 [Olpidium bornovanus]|uniref:Uncharacterized protein n=1 Tax=Olpidium bornovanus TaxID=278681 RepID=A0A8H7ZP19_9FUNG|nr:MAG: hypothetical protein BJ554DRAFT_3712 [Olpidium bornovanus]